MENVSPQTQAQIETEIEMETELPFYVVGLKIRHRINLNTMQLQIDQTNVATAEKCFFGPETESKFVA